MSLRFVIALLLALLAVAPSMAQPPPGERMRLTATQKEQLREIRVRYKQIRGPNQVNIKAKRLELMQLLSQDQPDKGAVNAKVAEIMQLQNAIQQSLVDEIFEVRSVLTPEQWRNLRSRMIDQML